MAAGVVSSESVIPEVISVSEGEKTEMVSQAVAVATVDIHDAKIIAQTGQDITVLFNLHNTIGVQSGVVYGVELYSRGVYGNRLIDVVRINDDPITLGEDETLPVAVTYSAPTFLTGKFEVWVSAKTESGLPLSISQVGTVLLEGSGDYVEVTDCQVKVAGKNYLPAQGVDISRDETMSVTCLATNNSATTKKVSPVFVTYSRSVYGSLVPASTPSPQYVALHSGAEQKITFVVPTAQEPQAYEVVLQMVDEEGVVVSPKVIFHYVIQGESATVQNIVFDKAHYGPGDNATMQIAWSLAADSFTGARGAGTDLGALSMSVVLADGKGEFCSSPATVSLDQASLISRVTVPVTRVCTDPQAVVDIVTAEGNRLAGQSYGVAAVAAAEELRAPSTAWSSLMVVVVTVVGVLLLLVIAVKLYSFAFIKRIPVITKEYTPERPSRFDLRSIIMLLMTGGTLCFGASVPVAEAVTFYANAGADTVTFTMSTNKPVYTLNESVQVGGSVFSTGPGNAVMSGKVDMKDGTGAYATIGAFAISETPSVFSKTITGYSTPINGSVPVRGQVTHVVHGANVTATVLAGLPFSVQCPTGTVWDGVRCVGNAPVPSGTISATGCTIAVGNSTCVATLTWSTENAVHPVVKNVTTNTVYSYNVAGTGVSRTIAHGVNAVVVYEGTSALAATTATGKCSNGSSWNGAICEATGAPNPVPSGTISATTCEINTGEASCVTKLDWHIQNATAPNVHHVSLGVIQTVAVNSAVPVTIAYGSHDFRARDGVLVLDTATASAGCKSDAVWDGVRCVGVAALDPISVSLTANGDQSDTYVITGDDVRLDWTTRGDIDQCTATQGWSGVKAVAGGTQWVRGVMVDTVFTLTCTGLAGTVSDTVTVHVQDRPNLIPVGLSLSPSAVFDATTGVYNSLFVQYSIKNDGEIAVGHFVNHIKLDRGGDGTYEDAVDHNTAGLAAGSDSPLSPVLLAVNVPFGQYVVHLKADSDDVVAEGNEHDNEMTYALNVPVPDIAVELHANPSLLRSGESVTLNWNTHATFPMNCVVLGPKVSYSFDPSTSGASGSRVVTGITSKSEFMLTCTEPKTNTVFTDSDWVEVVPTIQEI